MATTTKKSPTKKPRTTKKTSAKKSVVTKKKTTTKASVKTTISKNKKGSKSSVSRSKFKLADYKTLRIWNWVIAALQVAQGVAIIALSDNKLFSVSTNFITTDKLASPASNAAVVPATRTLFDINIAYIIAGYFFISALTHLLLATVCRKYYESDLDKEINSSRWIEFAATISTMSVVAAMIVGVRDISTLGAVFGLSALMWLSLLVMDFTNKAQTKVRWASYIVGNIAGALSWLIVGMYMLGASKYGEGQPIPSYASYVAASLFAVVVLISVINYLRYRRIGKLVDYIHAEQVFAVLSLVAGAAVAWQVYFGLLQG